MISQFEEDNILLNKDDYKSIQDLSNIIDTKSKGKLLLFNKKNELLVTQRNHDDKEYPMHYSLIDFIIDKDNNILSTLIDKATSRQKIKISYYHHNNPEEIINDVLYIIKFESDIIYNDKKMNKVFWASEYDLDNFRNNIDYILTPLFKKLLSNYIPFYDKLYNISYDINLGDLEYYNTEESNLYMLYKPYSYMKSTGGKELRSKLIDMCSLWIPIKNSDKKELKKIIEDIHCCTLIIDDIEDGSEVRRKCKCSHILYGESLTINAAYMKIFDILNKIDKNFSKNINNINNIVVQKLKELHEGQGADIYWSTNKYCPSINEYLSMINKKSGALFNIIPILCHNLVLEEANFDEDKIERINLFFRLLTDFFQIRDDYINLTSFNYWQEKGLCTDIEEGKFTYPIILAMTNLEYHDEIYEIMTSNERYEEKTKLNALEIIQRSGALKETRLKLDELKIEILTLSKDIEDNEMVNSIFEELVY